jgi:hypothetical protein
VGGAIVLVAVVLVVRAERRPAGAPDELVAEPLPDRPPAR